MSLSKTVYTLGNLAANGQRNMDVIKMEASILNTVKSYQDVLKSIADVGLTEDNLAAVQRFVQGF